jgi:tetratricopeptide (TPR) repeat protein
VFSRPEEGQLLFDAAAKALQSGEPSEHAQGIPLLMEATNVAPDDAQAWGLMAVLYAARRLEVPESERPAMIARARSAIKSALALDPTDARARCAEVILITPYRNWSRKEEAAREVLAQFPDQPIALFSLATLLGHAGRWREAAEAATRISRTKFLLPVVEEFTVQALWAAGDLVQAELSGDRAARRFPTHAGLWNMRVAVLMHSGRAADALNFIEAEHRRPAGYLAARLEALRLTALALLGKVKAGDAVRKNLEAVTQASLDPVGAALEPLMAARRCAALGALDECFSLLDGYYFARGPFAEVAPAGGDEDRLTWPLFTPPMASAWEDDRFGALTAAVGLDDYWVQSGSRPDYLSNR